MAQLLGRFSRSTSLVSLAGLALLASCGSDKREVDPPVTAATLQSLVVSVDIANPAKGETVTASVKGRYSDGTDKDLVDGVAFTASDPAVLEQVAGAPNKFVALVEGAAQINAAVGAVRSMSTVTVGPAKIVGLELVPASKEVGLGGTIKIEAIATYSDGRNEVVTKEEDVNWATDNPNILRPSAEDEGYLITFGTMGTANISASYEGVTISGAYTVVANRIEYMIVTPANARIDMGNPVQYRATGWWSDRHSEDVTARVTWSSSDESIAVINASGLGTSVGDGEAIITATLGDISAMTVARTVTSACPYPEGFSQGVVYNQVMPPLFWVDAFDQTGSNVDFELSDAYCGATSHPTIVFVVSAGWCPYCPAFMAHVDEITPQLEEAGALVVYVVIETTSGAAADNVYANSLVNHDTMSNGNSIRVGDGETAGGASLPFGGAVAALPSSFVVRTRDMRVIASQDRAGGWLDLLTIVRDPERLW